MAKVVKFPIPTPEKFGPQRVSKKKEEGPDKAGQLNLFTGGKVIRLNKLTDFEEALLVIPFHLAIKLLSHLETVMRTNQRTELVCRAILFLLKVHHKQLVSALIFPWFC